MKRVSVLLALGLALTAPKAHAQFRDEFSGPGTTLGAPWTFAVPLAGSGSGEDQTHYDVSGGFFNDTLVQGSGLYQQYNYIVNLPSVIISGPVPADFYAETKVRANFDHVPAYTDAGLVILSDADNYTYFQVKHNLYSPDGMQTGNNDYTTVTEEKNQVNGGDTVVDYYLNGHANFAPTSTATTGVILRVEREPVTGAFTFFRTDPGGYTGMLGYVSSASTGNQANIYTMLSSLTGKHLGLLSENSGLDPATYPIVTHFDYFHTNAPIQGVSTTAPDIAPAITDNFNGPSLAAPYTFTLPGANPDDTTSAPNFAGGSLNIVLQNSGFYSNGTGSGGYGLANNANIAVPRDPGHSWYLTTRVKANFNNTDQYPLAGLLIYKDPSKVLVFDLKHNLGQNMNYASVFFQNAGTFNNDVLATYANIPVNNADYTQLIIERTAAATFNFLYVTADGVLHHYATLTSGDTGVSKQIYDFLSDVGGAHFGIFTNNSGAVANLTASFDYLKTNVVDPISGKLTLEGVLPATPSQKITFTFRPQPTGTAFTRVISIAPGSNVAYGIPDVPAGTYQVHVKGPQSLAVNINNVNTTGGPVTLPLITLLGGDANNDNSVDNLDLGLLASAYAASLGDSNYDPRADLNGDESVDNLDLGILANNYALSGDD